MAGYILCAALLCSLISSKLIPFCILYPLLAGTLEDMGVSPSKEMFPLALTCIACLGILPIGSGAASFAQSNAYLQASSVTEYAFVATNTFMGRWPVLVVCVLYAIFLAPKLAPDRPPVAINAMENAAAGRAVNKEAMDPFHEKCGYIVFFAVSIGLLLSSTLGVPPWFITLVGAMLVVITGTMKPREAVAAMPIGIWLLFVGAICLANALNLTGAGAMIGDFIAKVSMTLKYDVLIYAVFFYCTLCYDAVYIQPDSIHHPDADYHPGLYEFGGQSGWTHDLCERRGADSVYVPHGHRYGSVLYGGRWV